MKRKLGVLGLAVAALAAILFWQCHASGSKQAGATTAAKTAVASAARGGNRKHVDPRKLGRAALAGAVTDEDHAIVPRARVCADLSSREISAQLRREPKCTTADDQGRYALAELYAGTYTVAAAAKPYRPGTFHPGGNRKETSFEL